MVAKRYNSDDTLLEKNSTYFRETSNNTDKTYLLNNTLFRIDGNGDRQQRVINNRCTESTAD